MSASGVAAVGIGAALGAWLRWGLGAAMNALVPALPMGTLAANLIGGYLVGVAVAIFEQYGGLSPELRLFVITGFLGGLTTSLTFLGGSVALLTTGRHAHLGVDQEIETIGLVGLTDNDGSRVQGLPAADAHDLPQGDVVEVLEKRHVTQIVELLRIGDRCAGKAQGGKGLAELLAELEPGLVAGGAGFFHRLHYLFVVGRVMVGARTHPPGWVPVGDGGALARTLWIFVCL